jgi:Trypsin-like peptidase domain
VAGTAFTFGEGTLITCWHCVERPLGPHETYGVAIRRGGITSPYEFCSIDNLGRDENGADLALGQIDWKPGRVLTLAENHVRLGERVETYGYPFSLAVPDQKRREYRALTFDPLFLRGYVARLKMDEPSGVPVMDLDMRCPRGLSGAPIIREDRTEVIGVVFQEHTTMYESTVTLGLAHHPDTLRTARSAATDCRGLNDHLTSA